MKSKFKFKRGEIVILLCDNDKRMNNVEVQIVHIPKRSHPVYEVRLLSSGEIMDCDELSLQKKNKHSIDALRDEFEASIFAHLSPERNYDIEYDVLIKEVDSDHKIIFKFTSIGSTFIKGDK